MRELKDEENLENNKTDSEHGNFDILIPYNLIRGTRDAYLFPSAVDFLSGIEIGLVMHGGYRVKLFFLEHFDSQ